MNALANDQELRIKQYLEESGLAGAISVAKYDRGTSQADRERLRKSPPHILLTNYMMLEYLLVRPADREAIFANHRCRFLVLDEVHTYRGTLGSNIALLVRRLKVHLARARQDWQAGRAGRGAGRSAIRRWCRWARRPRSRPWPRKGFPTRRRIRQRDEAVQEFFGTLVGVEPDTIHVFGEELEDIAIPGEAAYPTKPGSVDIDALDVSQRRGRAAGALPPGRAARPTRRIDQAARRYRLLWDLNRWLIARPMSASQIVAQLKAEVPERKDAADEQLRAEVEAALTIGAALPDGTPGALRLRAHRFIRGGWQFHRCINPACGKLYPMGEEKCSACHHDTAPLYLCRNCGADYLRLVGDPEALLRPSARPDDGPEWMLYEPGRFEGVGAERRGRRGRRRQRGGQGVAGPGKVPGADQEAALAGRLARSRRTSTSASSRTTTPLQVTLVPARTRCLCCGGTAGSRNVITPVSLGTSAAVKVVGEGLVEALAEANQRPARPRRQGTAAGLQRQPPGRRPPGPVHHLRQPLRPHAPPAGEDPPDRSGC